ncbi:hypothetical protein D9758_016450 [Tetrapyrgos nigripes]|uniref:Uncharacterized protein n=1 Tax=Tetrapyrgos nigripes TaxID=182062 RepID=A0A8H5CD62_9AGAR|nr:hypothetical protein D9758_016450 [Tetrapyrgos nigripes]
MPTSTKNRRRTHGCFRKGPSTFNKTITIPHSAIIKQCLTLLDASISVDDGYEYPLYQLWNSIITWACLVFTIKYSFSMTGAPQYAFYRTTRPEPEGVPDRDRPQVTRATAEEPAEALADVSGQTETSTFIPNLVRTNIDALPTLDQVLAKYGFAQDFADGIPPQFDESYHDQEGFVEEPLLHNASTDHSVEDSFLAINNETITWRTPDFVVFEHLPNPSGTKGPRKILPRILIENKPFQDRDDVKLFWDKRTDGSKEGERQTRAKFVIDSHITQLRKQSQMLFSEYQLNCIYGIVSYGWYWKAWVLKRDLDLDGLPVAEEATRMAQSAFNKSFKGFNIELSKAWQAAMSVDSSGN